MKTVIVIPARFGSTRLPGKPLAMIAGKSLLYRTWSIAKAVKHVDAVYVATDNERIAEHARGFGADVKMTPLECENGTERTLAAIKELKPEIVLNLQGDAPLTPPWIIQALLTVMQTDQTVQLATPATAITFEQYKKIHEFKSQGIVGGTFVTFDKNYNALYFSKSMIPFVRNANALLPLYKHIGLYCYRYALLETYVTLSPTPLELVEGLEQLRVLENGIPIKIVPVDFRGKTAWSVDSQEDISAVEKIIAAEGELVP
ncbi:MAG: 3-deoxy-manno-octulosonate cytidylyltransferase [Gammaproteobacteria bacterium]